MTYSVHSGLDIPSCQETQRITRINSQTSIQRLSPLPFTSLMILDLERSYRLTEEKSDGAKISMTQRPESITKFFQFLGTKLGVFHISQMRLVVDVPLVELGEEVLWEFESDGDEVE